MENAKLLIRDARLLTMEEGSPERGDVLVEAGRVAAVGAELSQAGATVIDAKGRWLMPGIIDAHCHIGMWEDSLNFEGADGNEATDPITPQLRAIDAINPMDRCFRDAVAGGVTTACTGPGSANVIGGQFAALKLVGECVDDMVLAAPHSVKIAFGENPKTVYNGQKKMPTTRMASAALLRTALLEAKDYLRKQRQEDADKRPDADLKKEILGRVLAGELYCKAHAHRADDILTALRIAEEFGIQVTLDHCTEGYLIPEQLRRAKGVILGPILCDRSKPELRNLTPAAPGILEKAGIPFALMTDHPVIPIQYLLTCAILAHKEGLSEHGALACVTLHAAQVLGLDARIGSIAVGKDADMALYDAHPLDMRAHVTHTLVNGRVVYER